MLWVGSWVGEAAGGWADKWWMDVVGTAAVGGGRSSPRRSVKHGDAARPTFTLLPLPCLLPIRQVGEIGKLIDWAQSTSPAPPILGGRTSPAGYSSLLHGSRLSFGGGSSGLGSPLGNASNQLNQLRASLSGSRGGRQAPPSTSPSKRQLQVASPAGRSPLCSPSKMR